MNENQLRNLMFCNPLLKPSFEGVLSIDQAALPTKRPASFIYNLDPSHKPGSHWVAVYYSPAAQYWYFDSYANPPPKELTDLYTNLRGWAVPVQSMFSDVCGHYCICFLYLCCKGFSRQQIIHQMTKINDAQVKDFVVTLQNNK